MQPSRLVCSALAAIVLALSTVGRCQADATLFPMHIALPATDQGISMMYASTTGMFAKAGLDVQLDHSSPNGGATAAAVLSGTYDMGNSIVTAIFDAHMKGIPFILVAAGAVYDAKNPYSGMIVAADSPYQKLTDIKNGTVGLAILRDVGQLAMTKAFDDSKQSMSDVKFTEIPQSAGLAAVEAHRVVATELSNPLLNAAAASGKARIIPDLTALGNNFTFTGYFVTKDYAQKHPKELKTFVAVLAQAAKYTNAHPAETAALLSQESKIPLDVVQAMPRVQNGAAMSPAGIQPLIDAEAKYGFIAHGFPAAELIDPDVMAK
jgi:NitT/TauT family transport system substrate-binding protein